MTNEVDILVDSAFADYNLAEFESAEQKIREALLLSPTHGDALYLLGLIAYKKGVMTEAIDILTLVSKLYPNYPNYRLALAEVYQNYGNLEKAKELYLTETENPQAMSEIGWIELKQGHLEEAKKIFQQNKTASSYLGLAELSSEKQKLNFLKQAYMLEKSDAVIRALAHFYLNAKKYKEAEKYIKKLPKDKYLKALFFNASHKEEMAITLLKELTIENAFNWEVWLQLASVSEKVNDVSVAENAYRRALDLKRDSLIAAQGLARILMKQSRISEAIDIYQKLVRENPKDCETLLAVATILEGVGEYSEALGLYFNLLSLGQKGLSKTIERLILKLSKTDKDMACRFSEGWHKHFPNSKTALKLLTILKVLFVCFLFLGNSAFAQIPLADKDLDLLWQSKMAQMGDPKSQYQLGEIYETGNGVPKDLSKAIYYYQLSAQQEYLPSSMALAHLFVNEKSVRNEKKSLEWYAFAAERGDGQAANYLFHYYDKGNRLDKKQALYWLEKTLKLAFPKEKDFSRVSSDYERLKKEINL